MYFAGLVPTGFWWKGDNGIGPVHLLDAGSLSVGGGCGVSGVSVFVLLKRVLGSWYPIVECAPVLVKRGSGIFLTFLFFYYHFCLHVVRPVVYYQSLSHRSLYHGRHDTSRVSKCFFCKRYFSSCMRHLSRYCLSSAGSFM